MITGTLSNGYEITVDERKAATYQFSKLVGKASSKDPNERLYANAKILPYLIGEDGEEALLEYISEQTGEEPVAKDVELLIVEIIKLMEDKDKTIKKSSTSEES